ncbi:flavin reductase family protein [Marinomonas agarivorans]|nr:flavin reductase family protein [Marinomonas agarivorans]
MIFDFSSLSANNRYHLMTQSIIPRPIAWILTQNTLTTTEPTYNLAPFSYFAPLSSDPALLVVSIGNKDANIMKDTKHNLLENKACVLHIPSAELVEQVNQSAAGLAYGESELTHSGLALTPFMHDLPRISEAKIAMYCTLYDVHQLSESQLACYLQVQSLYVADDTVTQTEQRTTINSKSINPLSRLGGSDYNEAGNILTLKRPS